MRSTFIILVLVIFISGFSLCVKMDADHQSITSMDGNSEYVGESACISCHKKEYDLWKGSHHDWAMKVATDETVLGDFNNARITLDGVSYHFRKVDGQFKVDVTETDGSAKTYSIAYTFGVTPLQQYITQLQDGKHQVLRVSWNSLNDKWYHQYEGQTFRTDDWLHWTQGGQRWNTMCAECHSTDLKRNYDWAADTFHTTWSSINVSCEACHGAGREHVQWAEGKAKGTDYHLKNDTTQRFQIDQCAPCHARRGRIMENMETGLAFEEQYLLQTLTPEFYHPDGQILEEDYVTGSFLQSKMYMHGVKCTDCHNPHSMELLKTGNDLCMQCHDPKYDSPEHHFHPEGTESAQCVNCHMTGRTYMGLDFRRDHSFRVPRPDQSVVFGTPNACTGCHTDRTDEWAAENIVAWYGDKRPEHFSDALLLTTMQEVSPQERQEILRFINDQTQPYIARATAIENHNFHTSETAFNSLISAMSDASALVRYKALMKFMEAAPADRHSLGLLHLADTARIVRIAAARLTLDMETSDLPAGRLEDFQRVQTEYRQMLLNNLDFPTGRLHYGDYLFRKNQLEEAILQYEIALEMDSLLTPVYPNLATAYSRLKMNEKALHTLNTLLAIDNGYGRGYYLRGLLHYQLNDEPAAIADFQKAIELEEYNFRAYYNLATLHYQRKDYKVAESTILNGLKIHPESGEGKYLLALIYRALGKNAAADKIMNELNSDS